MQMSNFEILQSYKQAKDPLDQVKILAQLNGTDIETINEILRSQGVDGKKLPRPARKGKTNKSDSTKAASCHNVGEHKTTGRKVKKVPELSDQAVTDYIYGLKRRRKELAEEIAEIDKTLRDIATVCGFPPQGGVD